MADRLISADVLKANATREYKKYAVAATLLGFGKAFREIYAAFIEEIDNTPTIEAEPRKHGRWRIAHGIYDDRLCCTVCGHYQELRYVDEFSYCPRCGAKMDEVEE